MIFQALSIRIKRFLKQPPRNRFVVEQLSNVHVSGWIMPMDKANPSPDFLYLIVNGKRVECEIKWFHRPSLAKYKGANLYGFRVKYKQGINRIDQLSIFYKDGDSKLAPTLLNNLGLELAPKHSPIDFINTFVYEASIQNIPFRPSSSAEELDDYYHQKQREIEGSMRASQTSDLSNCMLKVGTKSKTRTAIIGREGHLFLYGGSNNVDALFRDGDMHVDKLQSWLDLISSRTDRANNKYQFLQVIIPEKQSLLSEAYYRPIEALSSLLQKLENARLPNYFSAFDALSCYKDKDIFFRTDSHLNAEGTFLLFTQIMQRLGIAVEDNYLFNKSKRLCGDLGKKFAPLDLWEQAYVADAAERKNRQLVHEYIPKNGAHMGRHIHWVNKHPKIDRKVLIFGNSFSEFGKHQHHLTFWFSCYFRECQFVWSSDFNYKLIDKFEPDVVIGQSIERFMRLVPRY
ncbi:MAG: hypothetical protein Alis3KO_25680 [Aliiglaciecola sp.]